MLLLLLEFINSFDTHIPDIIPKIIIIIDIVFYLNTIFSFLL